MAEPQHTDPAGARKRTTSFADDQSKAGAIKCVPRGVVWCGVCWVDWNVPAFASTTPRCATRRASVEIFNYPSSIRI